MIQGALFTGPTAAPERESIAKVAVELPVEGTFEYRIPGRLKDRVKPGVRVRVSFSGRQVEGLCLEVKGEASVQDPLEISAVVDPAPLLSEKLLDLIQWMSRYYHCPVGEVVSAALPRVARKGSRGRRTRTAALNLPVSEAFTLAETLLDKKPKQARILRILAESGGRMPVTDLCSRANVSRSPVETLQKQGMVDLAWIMAESPAKIEEAESFPKPDQLSREQEAALNAIRAAIREEGKGDFLLYGVTGSGKTEIYLRAIEEIIALGKGAIVLVPEISLTPQTIARFKGRFQRVAVLHSRLTDTERLRQWKTIQDGGADVVVGARSAVFAPLPRLGLLVVDEEHETSFKQQNAPQYHARTVALQRGGIEGASVILGSATPSLEAFHQAQTGRMRPLVLRSRVGGGSFPRVAVMDMAYEKTARGAFLSEPLKSALSETLSMGKQAILFLNRRGYHTVLFCAVCKTAARCGQCDISLTLHRKANRLICHYCGFEMLPPAACPSCRASGLRYIGGGTERVEHEVRMLFPEARILRMDSDTMAARGAHEEALSGFKDGKIDILIGTQMIAKGLDFPGVTLVGVVSADTPLYQPDFRSAERAYHLLAQVAGRAGRGRDGGKVIVQTYNPEHYSIYHAVRNDYSSFAKRELAARKEAGYPPFFHLLRAVISGEEAAEVEGLARDAAGRLALGRFSGAAVILGPARAPITMISGRYRWHLLVKSPERHDLDAAAANLSDTLRAKRRMLSRSTRMALDVDPLTML